MKFTNVANLQTDAEKELNGTWVDFGEGRELLLARAGGANRRYHAVFAEKMAPYEHLKRLGQMTEEQAIHVLHETFVETIVKDWRGWQGEGGPATFNPENVISLFQQVPEVFWRAKGWVDDRANYTKAITKEAAESVENFTDGNTSMDHTSSISS